MARKLLVIDDDPVFLKMLRWRLSTEPDCQVTVAKRPLEVLELLIRVWFIVEQEFFQLFGNPGNRFKKNNPRKSLMNDWVLVCRRIEEVKGKAENMHLSSNLFSYLVVAEDHRFWIHSGFDPVGLLRAIWKTNFKKTRQGGSTIAMQLVRTITGNYDSSYRRKLKEIFLAVRLTRKFDRNEILRAYLLVAYFGWNMHGIEQACRKLKLNIRNLEDDDAASVIARLKYPEPRHFNLDKSEKITSRTLYILNRSKRLGLREKNGTI